MLSVIMKCKKHEKQFLNTLQDHNEILNNFLGKIRKLTEGSRTQLAEGERKDKNLRIH